MKIIDYEFEEHTKRFFFYLTCFYWITYIIPICLLVTEIVPKYCFTPLIVICSIVQVLFFIFEILQIIENGPKKYLNDYWNFIDVFMFVINALYLGIRSYHSERITFLPQENIEDRDELLDFTIFLAVLMVLFARIKGLSLIRYQEEFG